jgi:CheY-like chemotaxis protein
MDGYAVASALSQGEEAGRTSSPSRAMVSPRTAERARKAGFDRHLAKPADPSAHRRLLADLGRRA